MPVINKSSNSDATSKMFNILISYVNGYKEPTILQIFMHDRGLVNNSNVILKDILPKMQVFDTLRGEEKTKLMKEIIKSFDKEQVEQFIESLKSLDTSNDEDLSQLKKTYFNIILEKTYLDIQKAEDNASSFRGVAAVCIALSPPIVAISFGFKLSAAAAAAAALAATGPIGIGILISIAVVALIVTARIMYRNQQLVNSARVFHQSLKDETSQPYMGSTVENKDISISMTKAGGRHVTDSEAVNSVAAKVGEAEKEATAAAAAEAAEEEIEGIRDSLSEG